MENFTFIGANATVLSNIQTGTNLMVATGVFLIKKVPGNTIVVRNFAVLKKHLPALNF